MDTTGPLQEATDKLPKGWKKICIHCGNQWFIEFKKIGDL
jgi:hypothetical protein